MTSLTDGQKSVLNITTELAVDGLLYAFAADLSVLVKHESQLRIALSRQNLVEFRLVGAPLFFTGFVQRLANDNQVFIKPCIYPL